MSGSIVFDFKDLNRRMNRKPEPSENLADTLAKWEKMPQAEYEREKAKWYASRNP
jgi:hypothetical protein